MLRLSAEQLKKIKLLTAFELKDILEMDNSMFFFNITRLMSRGTLSEAQHKSLEKMRVMHRTGGNQQTFDVITTFGGQVIK